MEPPPTLPEGPLHLRDKACWDVDLVVDDRWWARIDVHIGTEIDATAYRACDLYFKRYIDRRRTSGADWPKLRPYTLVYDVVDEGFDRYEASRIAAQPLALPERARQLARFLVACLRSEVGAGSRLTLHDLRAAPDPGADPVALFMTRLWDPARHPQYCLSGSDELHAMNELRAGCIRALRRELGPRFEGGVQRTPFTVREYRDIVHESVSDGSRRHFIEAVRRHPVCVTTAGPHRSNGFKFAEYVAMSRAIVAEPVDTEIPGRFTEPGNYLTFATPDACVDQVVRLLADPALRESQMRANARYFECWMQPERLARKLVDAVAERAPWSEGVAEERPLAAALRS
ncbi:MAG: glycosyltransferase [Steroidobacteraceae bacterium]|jgi:hypothetical protein|nr:glycosyltransferase [Steroidobacteraceae bacterium]